LALAAWLAVLWRSTGHIFGDPGFTHYNVAFALHPVRIVTCLLRRVWYLGIADFRSVVRTSFGDPVIVFFIGVLILAAAFTQSGLGTRLTYLAACRWARCAGCSDSCSFTDGASAALTDNA
jgi:di/tricarboxylate transporter